VPNACDALADLLQDTSKAADQEGLLNEHLRKYIEATGPSAEEEDSKRRGLLMLNQLGER
jgi:hypothetical protein